MRRKTIALLVALLSGANLYAQQPVNDVEMADAMRADGMIYVVVAVVAVIMAGFVAYLFATDRKVSRIERELKGPTPTPLPSRGALMKD